MFSGALTKCAIYGTLFRHATTPAEARLRIKKTAEFGRWYDSLSGTERTRIDARLDNMAAGHLGDSRSLGDGLFELRWKNGMRVYYSRKRIGDIDTIVLWGGFKGSQKSDIARARRLMALYEEAYADEEGDGKESGSQAS